MTTKRVSLILILILLVLSVLKLFQFLNPKPSIVVQSFPKQNATSTDPALPIKFLFDNPLKKEPFISTSPRFDFTKSLDSSKTVLTIIPNIPFQEGTNYEISLSGENITPFVLMFKTEEPPPPPTPSPKTTPTPNPLATPQSTQEPQIESIRPYLPIITNNYTIQYLPKLNKFLVFILKNPYEANKKEAENWFKDHGIRDLSKLNIEYGSSRGVAP